MFQNYLERLKRAFEDDANFERVVETIETDRAVTKDDVERIYNSVFGGQRKFPTKRSKTERIEEIRRERLVRIRHSAA